MSVKKIIWISVAAILIIVAIIDGIRYLKPHADNKQKVLQQNSFAVSSGNNMVLVYNAWGGIYPGLVDFIHKEFFPNTYPCNLCYQTFSTFGMKEEWRQFIDGLPLQRTELHKDNFQRMYKPEDMKLPVILISNGKDVQVLISAAELNQHKSLQELIAATKIKLQALIRK